MSRNKIWDILSPFFFTFFALILVSVFGLLIGSVVTGVDVTSVYRLYQSLIERSISCAYFILMIFLQRKNYAVDSMRFPIEREDETWKRNVGLGAAGLLVLIAVSAIFDVLGISRKLTVYESGDPTIVLLLLVLETIVLAPIAEEMIFRGMIYRRSKYYMGVVGGIVVSALLFGVYHMNVVQGIYATIAGIVFAFIYENTGNIRTAVIVHAVHNALVLLQAVMN